MNPAERPNLSEQLEDAKAKVAQLERQIATGACAETGHRWKSIGGCNAGCGLYCNCSVPVLVCEKCGDCDYGDNAEADAIRAECAMRAA